MPRNFSSQLAGQIGESLVVAELGRRGVVATSFAGNVPDIDLLAYANGRTCHLQVKALRAGEVSFSATRFMDITMDGDRQIPVPLTEELDGDLQYVFVKLASRLGEDRFFILNQRELQKLVVSRYQQYLAKHGGIRPRNPHTTHTGVKFEWLEPFENNWRAILQRLAWEGA